VRCGRKRRQREVPPTIPTTTDRPPSAVHEVPHGKKPGGAFLCGHLTEHSEPRSAADVATALDKGHPERGIKTTVVRTTFEGLVAKNRAQRAKQGGSVFYTAPHAARQTAATSQDEAQPEQAE
jgi:hypothetical protein